MRLSDSNHRRTLVLGGVAGLGLSALLCADFADGETPEAPKISKREKAKHRLVITNHSGPELISDEPDTGAFEEEEEVIFDFQAYSQQAVDLALRELESCYGADLECQPNVPSMNPYVVGLQFLTGLSNSSRWQISCETAYPYEQRLYVAVNPFSHKIDFSNSDVFSPFAAPSFMDPESSDLYETCNSVLHHQDGQLIALEEAEEEMDDFMAERGFDFEWDDDGIGCFSIDALVEEDDGTLNWVAMDICTTDHPLKYQVWAGNIYDDDSVDWTMDGTIFSAYSPYYLPDAIENIVAPKIGLEVFEVEDTGAYGDTGGY